MSETSTDKVLFIGSSRSAYLQDLPRRLVTEGLDVDVMDFRIRRLVMYRSDGARTRPLRWPRIPGFRRLSRIIGVALLTVWLWKNIGSYSVCQVHFVSGYLSRVPKGVWRRSQSLLLFYWGSDLLRAGDTKDRNKRLLDASQEFAFNSEHTRDRFLAIHAEVPGRLCRIVRFPLPGFEFLQMICAKWSVEDAKRRLGLPIDRLVVAVGYNRRPEQQHLPALAAMSCLPEDVKRKVHLLLPLTYGGPDEYVTQVESAARRAGFTPTVIRERTDAEPNALLRRATQVMIHVQTSDSFSATMQETLYAGSVVINGAWLTYRFLRERGARWLEVPSIGDLPAVLTDVVERYEHYKTEAEANGPIVAAFSSWDAVRDSWIATLLPRPIGTRQTADGDTT